MHTEKRSGGSEKRKNKYVDFGSIVISREEFKWILMGFFLLASFAIAAPTIIFKSSPKHKPHPDNYPIALQKLVILFNARKAGHNPRPDSYSVALQKALSFFNAQKSGILPEDNGIDWRGNSGLRDGMNDTNLKGGLVGGYYDAGDNVKFHFPMAYAMTMLSWSVIEYSHKYKALGKYGHVRELIKWGTDYLLLTFNSSATKIDKIYCQVGGHQNGSVTPDDHNCWQKPEQMEYTRPTQTCKAGPELAGEMAAALAAASIVFQDNDACSNKLIKGSKTLFAFARDIGRRRPYNHGNPYIAPYYRSTGHYNEYMWGATWLFYATGHISYLSLAIHPGISKNSKAFNMIPDLTVLSWDNKLPAAMLLLARLRMFLKPGYPYEDMLLRHHNATSHIMCSYLQYSPIYQVFNWTRGGMIMVNRGRPRPLQYVANTAFLASLFVDYMNATDALTWGCGPYELSSLLLRGFATSQMDYILGKNPMNMSYVVGYGTKFPGHVHYRGASTLNDHKNYSCKEEWKWQNIKNPNPNTIIGAMVGGPDESDQLQDVRSSNYYTEPTMAGNVGLVAALVSLTNTSGNGVNVNTIFSALSPLISQLSPTQPPSKP